MSVRKTGRSSKKPTPPGDTGQEALYLKFLSEKQVPVTVKLRDGELLHGWIEYFDDRMIRLTREGKPNLFIYKHQVRTISELARRKEGRGDAKARDTKEGGGMTKKAGGEGDVALGEVRQPVVLEATLESAPIRSPEEVPEAGLAP